MRLQVEADIRAVLLIAAVAATVASPSARYLVQRQDHFDGSNSNTWLQAYYVNDSQWTPGTRAPVFLCIGGEGPPLDGSVVTLARLQLAALR
jgi:serine protease 16